MPQPQRRDVVGKNSLSNRRSGGGKTDQPKRPISIRNSSPKSGSRHLHLTPNKDKMVMYPERKGGQHDDRRRSNSRDRRDDRSFNHKTNNKRGEAKNSSRRLDETVKKARDSRNPFYNNRILEIEERNPNRWGHSGYKELYHDTKSKDDRERHSRSRSRSSIQQQRKRPRYSVSPNNDRHRSNYSKNGGGRERVRSRSRNSEDKGVSKLKIKKKSSESPMPNKRNSDSKKDSGKPEKVAPIVRRKRSRSNSSSESAESDSSNSLTNLLLSKRTDAETKSIIEKVRQAVRGQLGGSSSRSSSSDEDVLQLHPRKRGFSTDSSRSSSVSSRSSSLSRNSTARKLKIKRHSHTNNSSYSSESEQSDDSAKMKPNITKKSNSTTAAKEVQKKPLANTSTAPPAKLKNDKDDKNDGKGKQSTNITNSNVKKTLQKSSVVKAAVAKSSPTKPVTKTKDSSKVKEEFSKSKRKSSGEETSGSSDESDVEKKISLSERFSKLSQVNRDKREFSKPLLNSNQIDKKLKIVKDLRTSDVKVILDNPPLNSTPTAAAIVKSQKPKNPIKEFHHDDDDRRKHFEMMSKNEPHIRPEDWSLNPRVRYEFYKSKGCFDNRPITLDEYVKWEDWWFEYKEWLQEVEEFQQQQRLLHEQQRHMGPPPGHFNNLQMGPPRPMQRLVESYSSGGGGGGGGGPIRNRLGRIVRFPGGGLTITRNLQGSRGRMGGTRKY